jgi:hypothetical protein
MKTKLVYLIIAALLISCTRVRYSPEIEEVLKQAGNNRGQLEKVLKRYSRNPDDSLKLRAAEFLIINMPGKYSEYYDAPWEDVATACYLLTYASNKEQLLNDYRLRAPIVQDDLHYVTARYLIDNIEMAFEVWTKAPWGRQVTFDVFCDEILPYRISTESLDNWREQALASFADVYRSLLDSANMTAVKACGVVNGKLPSFTYCKSFPPMNYRQLMASTSGTYEQQATLAAFVMRSMGIPVTWEVMLLHQSQYAWNVVCDSTGRHIPFIVLNEPPGHWTPENDRVMARVLRNTFRRHTAVVNNLPYMSYSLDNLLDVSSEYDNVRDIIVPVRQDIDTVVQLPEYACLAITNSLSEWMPVCWGKYSDGTYHFASININMLYLPVIYDEGRQISFNQPFFLTDDGKIIYFEQYEQISTEPCAAYPRWHNVKYDEGNATTIDNLTGWWLFEDSLNYGKATVGKDMTAYRISGESRKGKPSTIGLKQVDGPQVGKKAVRVSRHTYFRCMHDIRHNGRGKNINDYTIMMDVRLLEENRYCFFQTNTDNDDNVDLSLYPGFSYFGVSKFYCYFDPPLREKEWYRLVVSARLGQSLKYYLNGELVFANYNTRLGVLDSRLSWSKEALLLFADDSGEDSDIDVSEVAIFGRALADEEVFSLGCAGNKWNNERYK